MVNKQKDLYFNPKYPMFRAYIHERVIHVEKGEVILMIVFMNQLANVHIESLDSNGSVNLGSAIIKSLNSNAQSVGGQFVAGDFSPLQNGALNTAFDQDAIDQAQKQL